MAIQDDFTINLVTKSITTSQTFVDGKPPNIYSMNEFYTWLQDTFDEPDYMDDQVPISAQTPTEYTLINQWHIDDTTIKTLFGGSLQTSGWNRTATNAGIILVAYTGNDPIASDIGDAITHADGDAGVLLGYDTDRKVLWIRPDSTAGTDDWDTGSGTITFTSNTSTQSGIGQWGETIWHNVFSLGTLELDTELYVGQEDDYFEVTTPTLGSLTPWWDEDVSFVDPNGFGGAESGHIDLLVKIQEVGSLIDGGRLEVHARQYSKLYDHFQITATGSGRTPIPLSTGDDLNNTTGYRSNTMTGSSGTIAEGDIATGATSGAEAVVTAVTGTDPTKTFEYYLIGKDLTDFTTAETVNFSSGGSGTTSGTGSVDSGPALLTGITVTFGDTQQDVNDDGTNEEYSVTVNCNSQALADVYERLKYLTRRGSTTSTNGQEAQFYKSIGSLLIQYTGSSVDDAFQDGETITDLTAGGTAVVTAHHDTGANVGFLIVRSVKGTITSGNTIQGGTSSHTATVNGAPSTIVPTKTAPFGTFAGGTFFGARGVYLSNIKSGEETSYQLITSLGVTVNPPSVVSIQVTNVQEDDRVVVFRLTAALGSIKKDIYTLGPSGQSAIGDEVLYVTTDVAKEYPNASTLRVVDNLDNAEQRYHYSSFSASGFVLTHFPSETATSADAGGTTLTDTGMDFVASGVEVGMLVRNVTDGSHAVVTDIDPFNVDSITHTPLASGVNNDWEVGDTYEINRLIRAYDSSDTLYPAYVDEVVASGVTIASNSITYPGSTVPVIIRVRRSSSDSKLQPFQTEGTINDTGLSVAAIRTSDSIAQ